MRADTLTATAGRNLSVVSAMDSFHYRGGTSGNKGETLRTVNAASDVGAGGNLSLAAGADASRDKGHIAVAGSGPGHLPEPD